MPWIRKVCFKMKEHIEFHSVFAEDLQGFIQERRAIGYQYHKAAQVLHSFDAFAYQFFANSSVLSRDIIVEWMHTFENNAIVTQQMKLSLLRGFANYLLRLGKSAYVYPKATHSIERYSYIPYIFSEKEMQAIFAASDQWPIVSTTPNRHIMLPVLIRLLYSCGLRISEALHLKTEDVDVNKGTLWIRKTKFNKERFIPMSENMRKRCEEYTQHVFDKFPTEFYFPSPFGGYYDHKTVYDYFRKILWDAGISHTGKGPRLQDVRHTFAVHCLKKWVINGKDITACLPYLSAYLGHEDLRGTQHYLRLTTDLYPDIISKVETSCSWIIPEVNSHEAN